MSIFYAVSVFSFDRSAMSAYFFLKMYIFKILSYILIDILYILDILNMKWEFETHSTFFFFFACFINAGRPNRAGI